MRKGGLNTDEIFMFGWRDNTWLWLGDYVRGQEVTERSLEYSARHWKAAVKKAGIKQLWVYLVDEATTDDGFEVSKLIAEKAHECGFKTWVACYDINRMADYLDLANLPGNIRSRQTIRDFNRRGMEFLSYADPQAGTEEPWRYRRNFGLLLWSHGYAGGMTWAWYGNCSEDAWDDFGPESFNYRDMNMVYPTRNGAVDTIQWEGWREGVDDCRYIGTLMTYMERARKGSPDAVQPMDAFIARLKTMDNQGRGFDLDEVRAQATAYIRQCQKIIGEKESAEVPPDLPQRLPRVK